jgi:peptidyl-prolyl cis-trans isomerase C
MPSTRKRRSASAPAIRLGAAGGNGYNPPRSRGRAAGRLTPFSEQRRSLMLGLPRPSWALPALLVWCLPASAQNSGPAVAATVNGQPVLEEVVQRGLDTVPAARRAEVRGERLNVLIDDLLLEQYLQQLMVSVDDKEVEKRIEEIRGEMKKRKQDFDKMLKEWKVTEAELRQHILFELRWEKFIDSRANDKILQDLFAANREVFDGTQVHARHILLTPASGDAKAHEEAQAQLAALKKEIEAKVDEGLKKVPADADALAREKARAMLIDDAFAAKAKEKSACPSKANGGDVGWFQRAGFMVEPFSKAAFALKPYEMSDVVKTPFGYHLILAVERKPGREVKFDEAKDMVKEYYAGLMRDQLAGQIRQKSKIEIYPATAAAATPLPPPKQ